MWIASDLQYDLHSARAKACKNHVHATDEPFLAFLSQSLTNSPTLSFGVPVLSLWPTWTIILFKSHVEHKFNLSLTVSLFFRYQVYISLQLSSGSALQQPEPVRPILNYSLVLLAAHAQSQP
jgi:hypothetical protein